MWIRRHWVVGRSSGRFRGALWFAMWGLGFLGTFGGRAQADIITRTMDVEQEGCLVRLTVHYDWHEDAYETVAPDCRFTITRSGGWSDEEVEVFSGQAPIAEKRSEIVEFDAGPMEVFHVTCEPLEDWPPPGHWRYGGVGAWKDSVDIPEECWGTATGCRTARSVDGAGWLVVLLLVVVGGLAEAAGRRRR